MRLVRGLAFSGAVDQEARGQVSLPIRYGLLRTAAEGDLAAVPTDALCALPDAISFAQAATIARRWPHRVAC